MDYVKVTCIDGTQIVGWMRGGFTSNKVDYVAINTSPLSTSANNDVNVDTTNIADIEVISGTSVRTKDKPLGDYLINLPLVRDE